MVEQQPSVEDVRCIDGLLDVTVDPSQAAVINRALVEADIAVSELSAQKPSLEDVFLELTATTEEER